MKPRLSDFSETLLDAGRADRPENKGARQAKILASLGASAALAAAASTNGRTGTKWLPLKWLGISMVAGAVGASGWLASESRSPTPAASVAGPRERHDDGREPAMVASAEADVAKRSGATSSAGSSEVQAPRRDEPSAVSVWDLPAQSASAARIAHPSPSTSPGDDLSAQLRAIEDVRGRLARGDAPGALVELDAFSKRFPSSSLRDEVVALRIEALVRARRIDEAERAGREFLRTRGDSLYAPRVRSLIAPASEPRSPDDK